MSRRVVITGMGAITPVGNNVKEYWESLKAGKHGIGLIDRFDTADYKVKVAAQVKDFDAKAYMDPKSARRMESFAQYAVAASKEALDDSGLDIAKEDPFRIGCSIGSGIGSMGMIEKEAVKLNERGPSKVNPLFIPMIISNMAAGNVSIAFGLKGKNINVVTACATGTNSIGEAFRAVQYGDADVMLAGGCEAAVTPLSVAGFTSLTALTTNENPDEACKPFDKDRSGFVIGEGAGILILEELEHALNRGAHIYAEVAGYGCSADAYHITSPAEDGAGAAKAMEYAIKDAGLTTDDIFYINAHGTSTHHNDLFETRAIKLLFGDHAKELKVNSTKSMVGHLLGGAGAVEAIACVKQIEEGFIHKTVGFNEAEEEMDLDYCKEAVSMDVEYALSNSLGFGGHNGSILIKKWRDK